MKPENILVRAPSKKADLVPKLANFALRPGRWGAIHEEGNRTLMFMPPKQMRDASSVKATADLYAIG